MTTPLVLALALLAGPRQAADAAPDLVVQRFDFDAPLELAAEAVGEGARRKGVGAKVDGGELVVLEPWWRLSTAVGLDAPTAEGARHLEATFRLQMSPGSEGLGFAWLDTAAHGATGPAPMLEAWEAPSLAGSLGIGFDASDPWTYEPFRGSGNIHQRPEHEVSIHWDGVERFKLLTETDFRDEEYHDVALSVEWIPGGALVDLALDEEVLLDRYFLGGATPYAGRAAFGGRNTETAGIAAVDDLSIALGDRFAVAPDAWAAGGFAAPLHLTAIDAALNDKDHAATEGALAFPDDLSGYERILMTLTLAEPEGGYDPWDRIAHVFVGDERLGDVELLRYITPYDNGWTWVVDVTDFRPVLTGERTITQRCGTYGPGWLVSVGFDLYPSRADDPRFATVAERPPQAYRLERLWEGQCVVGNPEKPPGRFFEPRAVATDPGTRAAHVRTVVTGHGMSPNTDNAAEFMPLWRTLTVDGVAHRSELWKTDNYLNPCRPQGGTWKYDRAGWAPGDVVAPWLVEVPAMASAGEREGLPGLADRTLALGYALDPYVNAGRGQTWDPFHQVASYLVLER